MVTRENPDKSTTLDKMLVGNMILAFGTGAYYGYCFSQGVQTNDMGPKSYLMGTIPTVIMTGITSHKAFNKEFSNNIGMIPAGLIGLIHGTSITALGFGIGYITAKLTN